MALMTFMNAKKSTEHMVESEDRKNSEVIKATETTEAEKTQEREVTYETDQTAETQLHRRLGLRTEKGAMLHRFGRGTSKAAGDRRQNGIVGKNYEHQKRQKRQKRHNCIAG